MSKTIAIFASGSGSNALKIMEYFQGKDVSVKLLVTNNAKAGALVHAQNFGVETHVTNRTEFYSEGSIVSMLQSKNIDLIVLAGFLWLIPPGLVQAFSGRIVNIHPSLLPRFGGKGMYGHHVHEAVKASGDEESGMTVHFVNEQYDDGDIIFQAKVEIEKSDEAEDVARKVLALEHEHYPKVIDALLR